MHKPNNRVRPMTPNPKRNDYLGPQPTEEEKLHRKATLMNELLAERRAMVAMLSDPYD